MADRNAALDRVPPVGPGLRPDEVDLEARVLDELAPVMGGAALAQARLVGRSFALEDAVDMVESDAWPPVFRGGRLAP